MQGLVQASVCNMTRSCACRDTQTADACRCRAGQGGDEEAAGDRAGSVRGAVAGVAQGIDLSQAQAWRVLGTTARTIWVWEKARSLPNRPLAVLAKLDTQPVGVTEVHGWLKRTAQQRDPRGGFGKEAARMAQGERVEPSRGVQGAQAAARSSADLKMGEAEGAAPARAAERDFDDHCGRRAVRFRTVYGATIPPSSAGKLRGKSGC